MKMRTVGSLQAVSISPTGKRPCTVVVWVKTFCWEHETYHGAYGYETFQWPSEWPTDDQPDCDCPGPGDDPA